MTVQEFWEQMDAAERSEYEEEKNCDYQDNPQADLEREIKSGLDFSPVIYDRPTYE